MDPIGARILLLPNHKLTEGLSAENELTRLCHSIDSNDWKLAQLNLPTAEDELARLSRPIDCGDWNSAQLNFSTSQNKSTSPQGAEISEQAIERMSEKGTGGRPRFFG